MVGIGREVVKYDLFLRRIYSKPVISHIIPLAIPSIFELPFLPSGLRLWITRAAVPTIYVV
jgi:hypothetical protein